MTTAKQKTTCLDFTCGQVRTCRKCWGAAYIPALAASLGRMPIEGPPVKLEDSHPCGCGGQCDDCGGTVSILDALAESKTDKHRVHGYGPLYAELTASRPIRSILEIGILNGDSIRAWANAFPDAEIVAADIDPAAASRIADIPQARFIRLDVSDAPTLARFGRDHRNRFDLLIDDSTHKAAHQLLVRRHLYQSVRHGGVMVIEDIPNDAAAKALRGREFVGSGRWDSRCVVIERPATPRLLFSGNYLERDGAPILLANLATRLRGWTVTVHSPHDGPLREPLEAAGIKAIGGELRAADAADASLIVGNTLLAHPAIRLARELALPCVWMIHESDPTAFGAEIFGHVRDLIGYPTRVIFPCRATADAYRDMPPHRAAIIPTVIPPVPASPRPARADGMFRVITFGRDEPRKGQQDIREAIRGMSAVSLECVHDRPDRLDRLAAADLYICSSRVEAYPLSIQEAKAYGVPVITTPVFGAAEIIRDGIDGLHYAPGNVADLRAKIERVRGNADLRAKLSRPLTHLPSYADTLKSYEAIFEGAAGA